MKRRWIVSFIILNLLGSLLSGCSGSQHNSSGDITYQVSPSFREFYETLGGEDFLGPAISQSFSRDSYECQYTTNALMCLNPVVTDESRFFLYPIGDQMGISNTGSQTDTGDGSQVVDGVTIYNAFLPTFNQLSGEKYTGKPLTQARLNYSQKRVEQFFENIGFYTRFNDPDQKVYLMAYGVFACGSQCSYTTTAEAAVSITNSSDVTQPLLAGLSGMGDTSVIGTPITQPYIASDGMEEQVYTNVIVYADPNDLKHAKLRPLSSLLNIAASTPGPQKYDSSNGVVFYPTNGTDGFHVPLVFDKFIASHGGLDYSGQPIMEVYQMSDTTFRQCFENYCLDYHSDLQEGQNVQIAPLGTQYVGQTANEIAAVPEPLSISPQTVSLQVTPESQQIAATDEQKLDILVLRLDNQQPVTNVVADLTITLPDQTTYNASFPETGLDGRASLVVPAIKNLTNGQILLYQVCLNQNVTAPVCATGSYLIWSTN